MATAAQIAANQANARRSTGPRTPEGKAASARNHTSHGLCSREFLIFDGQQQEFDDFMTALRDALQPVGAVELDLFTQHAHASWTLRRCRIAEAALQFDGRCANTDPLYYPDIAERSQRIDLHARRAERTYHKTLKELQALQTIRLSAQLPETHIETLPALPTLVNPVHLNRQREAGARARAAATKAAQEEDFRQMALAVEAFIAPPVTAFGNSAIRTQSAPPAARTAGGGR